MGRPIRLGLSVKELWGQRVAVSLSLSFLILAIVTSSILIAFHLSSPLPSDSQTVEILLFRNDKVVRDFSEKLIKAGSSHKKGYGLLHEVNIFFPKKVICAL